MTEGVERQRIAIVGGGLVGSLWAVFLARHGLEVEVFERRPDLRKNAADRGRSINLVVVERGLHALRRVDLRERVLGHAVAMKGRLMHPVSGELAFQRYGINDDDTVNSISRSGLNALLLDAAEETGKVRFHFEHRLVGADLDAPGNKVALELETASGAKETQVVDVVFGADGSASALREAMAGRGMECAQEFLEYGYKEIAIPPGADGYFAMEAEALHIWPRGRYMLIALPNEDGTFTGTLFLPLAPSARDDGRGDGANFGALRDKKSVREFFRAQFPDTLELVPGLEEEFLSNPIGRLGTVRCRPWHDGGRALLIGDAAHGIVPFFGQGMNAGFEDCTLLDDLMEIHGTRWETLFAEFFRNRAPDVEAIADMALENFVEMRDQVADPEFLLKKAVEKILEREFSAEFTGRYSMVMFTRVPYRKARELGQVQEEILEELCQGLKEPENVNLKLARRLIDEKLHNRSKTGVSGEKGGRGRLPDGR